MTLSDSQLTHLIYQGNAYDNPKGIIVSPLAEGAIQPNSVDIRLGPIVKYSNPNCTYIHRWNQPIPDSMYVRQKLQDAPYVLKPHEFVLADTFEFIKIPKHLSCRIEGRSSVGRIGLFIVNAGLVDSGYEGVPTLELYNAEKFPIMLEYMMPIGQLVFTFVQGVVEQPYGHPNRRSKYQADREATSSRLYMEAE